MTSKHHLLYQILLLSIIGAFLLGCSSLESTPPPDQIDRSPFTGIPCPAPCWHHLLIGESSESDVISTISTLGFIDQNSVYHHRMPSMSTLDPDVFGEGVEITANCINSEKQCLAIQAVENILTEISIALNYQINIDEAIIHLDNPDYVGFDRAGGELVSCRVYLIWSEKQLVLASKIFEGPNSAEKNCFIMRENGKVSPKLLISGAKYMSGVAIEKLLSSSRSEFFKYLGTLPQ